MLHFEDKTPSSSLFSCLIYVSPVDLLLPKIYYAQLFSAFNVYDGVFSPLFSILCIYMKLANKSNLGMQIDKSLVENLRNLHNANEEVYSNLNWIQLNDYTDIRVGWRKWHSAAYKYNCISFFRKNLSFTLIW